MRQFGKVTVNKKAEALLRGGHIWVYGEELSGKDDDISNGDIVDVFNEKGRYLGSGFYNAASKIAVRILSANANETFDEAFFRRRVKYAVDYRRTVMKGDLSCTNQTARVLSQHPVTLYSFNSA